MVEFIFKRCGVGHLKLYHLDGYDSTARAPSHANGAKHLVVPLSVLMNP